MKKESSEREQTTIRLPAELKEALQREAEAIGKGVKQRTCGVERAPEASQVMVCVHKELVKTNRIFFVRVQVAFFAFLYFFKRFAIKRVKFIKG